jgi:PadR family transcriptional regulator, regulatory protein PadR
MQDHLCLVCSVMDMTAWQTQLRKGAAELVVLSILRMGDAYGVKILDAAGRDGGILSDGTVYPLLTRLEREGKIASRWVNGGETGASRKYYSLTLEGEETLAEMQKVWREFSVFVSSFMEVSADVRADTQRRGIPRAAG